MTPTSESLISDHDASHPVSASICDNLFEALRRRISGLHRSQVQRWCCFYQPGQKRFAYISHRKKQPRVEVWFLGDQCNPSQYPELGIRERAPTSGGFGKEFKARFYLDDAKRVQLASHFLIRSAGPIFAGVEELAATTFSNEVCAAGLYEGAVHQVTVNAYERNSEARERCIQHHGASCSVCGMDFRAVYGALADGFIHVHHIKPLSEIGKEYVVDPIVDLRPVCPNCHAVIHLNGECRSIAEARSLVDPRVLAFWISFSEQNAAADVGAITVTLG